MSFVDQENSYFIVLKDDCAYYNQLAAKIKLSKSKVSNTKDKGNILVSKRDFTEKEKLEQKERLNDISL